MLLLMRTKQDLYRKMNDRNMQERKMVEKKMNSSSFPQIYFSTCVPTDIFLSHIFL